MALRLERAAEPMILAKILLYLLALLCIAATVVSFSKQKHWWVRAADFPRQQITFLGLAVLAAWAALELGTSRADLFVLAALGLCVVYQLAVMLPYTSLWRTQITPSKAPPGPRSFSIVVVNVLMDNRVADRLVALLQEHQPDIVLAVETDRWWCEQLDAGLAAWPHRIQRPLDNTYGIALYAKLPLVEPRLEELLQPSIPSIWTGIRLRSGETVRLVAIHPEPPAPDEAETSLPRDAELVVVGRLVAEEALPTIVAGDLNDVAWSRTSRLFRRLSGLLDPRIGRGFFNSFHARYAFARWPLDHVFMSEAFRLRDMRRLPYFGSDHFPIWIALDYAPAAAAEHDAPAADREDRAEAAETLRQFAAEQREGEADPPAPAGPRAPA